MMATISIESFFSKPVMLQGNRIVFSDSLKVDAENQVQTEKIFSDKWAEAEQYATIDKLYQFQFDWLLTLYGFASEEALKNYLADKKLIIDTGCGLGYKAAWFARLAPHAVVLGIDISDALDLAAKNFTALPNLFFLKGDIANTGLKRGVVDFTVCDQVIMHTENPENTFAHLSDITANGGEFACYVYSKKALPRELVDDHFRKATHTLFLTKKCGRFRHSLPSWENV